MSSKDPGQKFDFLEAILSHRAARPEAVAVETARQQWTYAELDERSDDFRNALQSGGFSRSSPVAILLPRGFDLIAVGLGVVKMGGHFLPIDPEQPKQRLRAILESSGARIIVTSRSLESRLASLGGKPLYVEDCSRASSELGPVIRISAEELTYVIFTSGSTGVPKGVMIPRRGLNHFCVSWMRTLELAPGAKCTLLASPGFDMSIGEIWPTLAAGATVSVPDEDTRFAPHLLQRWILERNVTACFLATAVAELLIGLPWPEPCPLKVMVPAGDRLTKYPPAGLPFRFVNGYGPTELTVVATVEDVLPSGSPTPPAIGYPIAGIELFIVDRDFNRVPDGETGEIVLAGEGLARGYLNAPDQTAEKFVPNPFAQVPGSRCYRTGDLGFKDASGRLYFQGRIDAQLSIRGYRVEPVEICQALKRHPEVEDAYVTLVKSKDGATSFLVAYYVPRDRAFKASRKELVDFISPFLPKYMIPDHFVVVGSLPLNVNGKVDPKLLPLPDRLSREIRACKPPASDIQRKILEVWKRALDVTDIGVDENFFELGGHSLAAIQITAALTEIFQKTVTLKQFYEAPTVEALEGSMPRWVAPLAPPIVPVSPREHYPLSFQQEQVVFFQSLAPSSNAYNSQSVLRIRGPVDAGALGHAVNALTERHEILRTTYAHSYADAEPVQVLHPHFTLELPFVDLTRVPSPLEARNKVLAETLQTIFDLSRLPLAKWTLVKLKEDDFELILVEHHIVHDGWTLSVLFRELEELYNARLENREPSLSVLPIQYKDYATWQRQHIEGDFFRSQLDYWKKELGDAPRVTNLPYDFPRPKKQSFRGDQIRFDLPDDLTLKLKQFSKSHHFTNFEVMFAVFSLLIHKLSREQEVCVGSALANRERSETVGVIGMFVNTVVIRSRGESQLSFIEYAKTIKQKIVQASMNQAYPFPRLVQELNLPRDPSVNPLFQVMFSFHDSNVIDPALGGASCSVDHVGNSSAKQALDVMAIPRYKRYRDDETELDERLTMVWDFNRDLFKRASIQRFIDQYLHLFQACLSEEAGAIGELTCLPPKEVATILGFTGGVSSAPSGTWQRIHESFRALGDKACLVEPDRTFSYRDLGYQVETLREQVLQVQGPREEEPIAIFLGRGISQIAAQLAIIGTGKCFVPIDARTPAGRITDILGSAGITAAITDAAGRAQLPAGVTAIVAEKVSAPADWSPKEMPAYRPHQLAYVIFTSGSTGKPKGVAIELHSLCETAGRTIRTFNLSTETRTLVFNSPAFDSSLGEHWPTLGAGGTLFAPPDEVRYSAAELVRYIAEQRLTFADVPTALGEQLLKEKWPENHAFRTLIVGGERLKTWPRPEHRFQLYNEYGPTEATISATSGLVPPRESETLEVPDIGRPIVDRGCLVLDEKLRLVPIGVEGDLYLFGDALARGYYASPALTAERFVPNPFGAPGARMYFTGDRVRWTAEGTLQYCGRNDRQVKIHGYRIELDEISSRLLGIPGVTSVHSVVREQKSGKAEIVAFYTAGGELDPAALKITLARYLPSYMMPGKLVPVGTLPKTINGKIDGKKLLELIPREEESNAGAAPPLGRVEKELAAIWAELLSLESVNSDANFFELGGHSLLLAELQRRVAQHFDVKVPLFDFFEFTTVAALAGHIESLSDGRGADIAERRASSRAIVRGKSNLLARRSLKKRGD